MHAWPDSAAVCGWPQQYFRIVKFDHLSNILCFTTFTIRKHQCFGNMAQVMSLREDVLEKDFKKLECIRTYVFLFNWNA